MKELVSIAMILIGCCIIIYALHWTPTCKFCNKKTKLNGWLSEEVGRTCYECQKCKRIIH